VQHQNVTTVTLTVGPDPYEPPDKSLGAIHLDSSQLAAIHAVRTAVDRNSFGAAVRAFQSAVDNGFATALDSCIPLGRQHWVLRKDSLSLASRRHDLRSWQRGNNGGQGSTSNWTTWPPTVCTGNQFFPLTDPSSSTLIGRSPSRAMVRGTREIAAMGLSGQRRNYMGKQRPMPPAWNTCACASSLHSPPTVVGADATNAFANSPPPAVPTFVRIDDAYTNWYLA
jgi:hypothetical protein